MQIFWSYKTLRHQRHRKSVLDFIILTFKCSEGIHSECINHIKRERSRTLSRLRLERWSSSAAEGSGERGNEIELMLKFWYVIISHEMWDERNFQQIPESPPKKRKEKKKQVV